MAKEEYDVFEEIRQYDLSKAKMADTRRFSFSVPADVIENTEYDPLYDGCSNCGECPECLDGATTFILEGYADNYIKNSADGYDKYSGEYMSDNLSTLSNTSNSLLKPNTNDPITQFISKGYDIKQFKIPSTKAKDARAIWIESGLDSVASFNDIQNNLLRWSTTFAEIDYNDNINKTRITWKTESGCNCVSTWYNFIRWIICASISDSGSK